MTPPLLVENLEKRFPPALSGWRAMLQPFAAPTVRALHGVSFRVEAGESLALVGANGAGKSTLLRILSTLLLPTAGRAMVAGCDVTAQPSAVRRQIGLHSGGDGGFYSRLSAFDNLRFFATLNNLSGREAADRITRVMELMGLSAVRDHQVRTFSTGTVHRLGLARALLHAPTVLLLDEPTRSLDPMAAAEFRRFVRHQVVRARAVALLFATHSLEDVEDLADRVAILHAGRLLACDAPARLLASTQSSTLEQALKHLLKSVTAAGESGAPQ
jgi:ABC-2 type transport system ATP-binding protein